MPNTRFLAVAALVVAIQSSGAQGASKPAAAADSAAALAVVTQYEAALARGDSALAVSLLADDLMVLEAGSVETRADYLAHHLGADIRASAGAKGERTVVKVSVLGDVAYVITRTVRPGTGAPGSTGSELAELMVLSKAPAGWQIRAIHWSSRRRRA
ncbi:MAG: nuclear transport factor 2 family protein [Gemmatimonadaceae bacterium]